MTAVYAGAVLGLHPVKLIPSYQPLVLMNALFLVHMQSKSSQLVFPDSRPQKYTLTRSNWLQCPNHKTLRVLLLFQAMESKCVRQVCVLCFVWEGYERSWPHWPWRTFWKRCEIPILFFFHRFIIVYELCFKKKHLKTRLCNETPIVCVLFVSLLKHSNNTCPGNVQHLFLLALIPAGVMV